MMKYFRRFITFRASLESVATRVKYLYNYRKFLNSKNVNFFKEKITFPIQNKIDTDIKKVFSRIDNPEDVILKIDIDGSEYKIIDEILKYSNRIEMLIFEFHFIDDKEFSFFYKSFKNNEALCLYFDQVKEYILDHIEILLCLPGGEKFNSDQEIFNNNRN